MFRYLATLAAAEQLYDALHQWNKIGSLSVNTINQAFFQDFMPTVALGTYASSSSTYTTLTTAIKTYADGYMGIVKKYTPSDDDGRLAEQFSRHDGTPRSAAALTWSHASFLTAAAARRANHMPASWGEHSTARNVVVPPSCAATSAQGTYTTPTATTPRPPCATAVAAVAVMFNVVGSTAFGQTVLLAGSIPALGDWDPAKAVRLSAVDYRSAYPRWFGTVALPPGMAFEYKFVKEEENGGGVSFGTGVFHFISFHFGEDPSSLPSFLPSLLGFEMLYHDGSFECEFCTPLKKPC